MIKNALIALVLIFTTLTVNAQFNFGVSNTGLPSVFVINDFQVVGTDIYGAGSYFNGSNFEAQIYKSADNGLTWVQLGTTGLDTLNTGNALLNYGGNLFISGFTSSGNCMVYISNDAGSTWAVSNAGLPAKFVINEFRIVGTYIYGVGSYFNGTSYEGRIYKSADNGASWTQITTTGLTSLYTGNSLLYNSGTLFISGSVSNTTQNYSVYQSTDGGSTWTVSNTGLPSQFVINEFRLVGTDIYGAGSYYNGTNFEGRIYKSTDNGATWSQVTTTGLTGLYTGNALLFSSGKVFISGSISNATQNYSLYSSNDDVTGIANLPIEGLSIYPNPVHDQICIEGESSDAAHIRVFDILGNVVKEANLNSPQVCLDLSSQKNGTYIIEVSSASQEKKNTIIVKE